MGQKGYKNDTKRDRGSKNKMAGRQAQSQAVLIEACVERESFKMFSPLYIEEEKLANQDLQ